VSHYRRLLLILLGIRRGRESNPLSEQEIARHLIFHGRFYGLRDFSCKTVPFCATRRESRMSEAPSVAKPQAGETARKNPFLNYKSAAPSGEATLRNILNANHGIM
jgi:hypothetical protein